MRSKSTLVLAVAMLLSALCACGSSDSKSHYFTGYADDVDAGDGPAVDTAPAWEEETQEQVVPPIAETDYPATGDIAVPYVEAGGVKYVEVEINGSIGKRMIIDSGCSSTLMSVAEANYLVQKGALTADDIIGQTQSVIADGSITVDTQVCLRELVIGGVIQCTDVIAVVSDNVNAPMLLGNEVLNRAGAYTMDNRNSQIIFHNVPLE